MVFSQDTSSAGWCLLRWLVPPPLVDTSSAGWCLLRWLIPPPLVGASSAGWYLLRWLVPPPLVGTSSAGYSMTILHAASKSGSQPNLCSAVNIYSELIISRQRNAILQNTINIRFYNIVLWGHTCVEGSPQLVLYCSTTNTPAELANICQMSPIIRFRVTFPAGTTPGEGCRGDQCRSGPHTPKVRTLWVLQCLRTF